jgi:hypothetical protein
VSNIDESELNDPAYGLKAARRDDPLCGWTMNVAWHALSLQYFLPLGTNPAPGT